MLTMTQRIRHNNEVLGGNYTQLGDSASWYEGNAARLAVHIHSLLLWRISKPPVDDETRWL
jgi:hypothetical protein